MEILKYLAPAVGLVAVIAVYVWSQGGPRTYWRNITSGTLRDDT